MTAFPEFPALTAEAAVLHGDPVWEHPNYEIAYENGVKESRAITSDGRFSAMPVTMVLRSDTDFQTVFGFLRGLQLGVSLFYYTHPYLGRGLVKYNSQDGSSKLKFSPVVRGGRPWFQLDMIMEGQFGA